ncbi:MAG: hypothetical protein D6805_09930 [Planctomycetota bacterium]|nr:MAG: hypothetical protein D6805_09930 [Planctomycetota bacterium]
MNELEVQAKNLVIQAGWKDDDLVLQAHGEIDMEDPEEILGTFFQNVHKLAIKRSKKVILNIVNLKFVNSSGIKSFIRWIGMAKQLKQPYKIQFFCNPSFTWQRSSLSVIQKIAPEIVEILQG